MPEQHPNPDSVAADFADAFDDWLAGATISKRSVIVYGKPGLFAEYEDLERQREVLETRLKSLGEDSGEMAGSEASRVRADLQVNDTAQQALYDEWMASKSTWVVRALLESEIEGINDMEPVLTEPIEPPRPAAPEPLPPKHTEQQAKSHTVATKAWEEKMTAWKAEYADYIETAAAYMVERNFRCLAIAVERIEFTDGRVSNGISVERLRALRNRLGENQISRLMDAAQQAAQEEPEIPVPFSQLRDSKADQT